MGATGDPKRLTGKQARKLAELMSETATGKTLIYGPRPTDGMLLVGHQNRAFNFVTIIDPQGKTRVPAELDFPAPSTFWFGAGERNG